MPLGKTLSIISIVISLIGVSAAAPPTPVAAPIAAGDTNEEVKELKHPVWSQRHL